MLAHRAHHQPLPAVGHDLQRQRHEVVEGGIEHQCAQLRVRHGGPRGREAADGPAVDHHVRGREVQAVQRVLDHHVHGVGVVLRERRARAAPEARVVPAQHRIAGLQRRRQTAHLVEAGVALAADGEAQAAAMAAQALAAVHEHGVDLVAITGHQLGAPAAVAVHQALLALPQERQQCARHQEHGARVHEPAAH